ncbi:signal peptidase I [Halobacillus sp. ACCC02827]|uniref:signal peptidase I SipW n=1 Tax=Bacillaceae TaxID=186817 RepID=UPI0002A4E72C|nr:MULTISPECIES: signal peptidase I [Bacillaceae]ELK48029.1 signal peptidase I [Halobacillus sp. BAB-2008]QHT45663.1 signal peptidase I [Bacillus sp. SB49]WJE16462.1 signal peptidase I [Halobacillus sp. ACCC02827]
MKTALRMIYKTLSVTAVGLIVALAIVVIAVKASGGEPTLFGYQMKTVLSGSMEPTFQTGSVIAIEMTEDPSVYKEGDVLTFIDKKEQVVTHRVIDVQEAGGDVLYTTQGDNNDGADLDPVLSGNVLGSYTGFTIPYLGFVLNYAGSKMGSALLLFVPGILLFLYGGLTFRKAVVDFKKQHEQTEPAQR